MSVAVGAADSGVEVCTMSVTGRTVGIGAVVLTISMTGGLTEPSEDIWPESVRWGMDEGGPEGLEGEGGWEDVSLTQEVESDFGVTGGVGECLVGGLDEVLSTNSSWQGMEEFVLEEGGGSVKVL